MAEKTWRELYEEINKAKIEKKKPKEVKTTPVDRLAKQDPNWIGTVKAEHDSASVSSKMPQYTTENQKRFKKIKDARAEIKKVSGEIAKFKDVKEGYEALSKDELTMLMPEKKIEILSKIKALARKEKHLANIKKKYPGWEGDDPLGLVK